jgi:hypothetical protein
VLHHLSTRECEPLLAQRRHRQDDLRKEPQVAAAGSGDLELLDAAALIALNSLEAKKESLESRQAANDVIRGAQRKIGIGGVGGGTRSDLADEA